MQTSASTEQAAQGAATPLGHAQAEQQAPVSHRQGRPSLRQRFGAAKAALLGRSEVTEETTTLPAEEEKKDGEVKIRPNPEDMEGPRWGRMSDSLHPAHERIDIGGNVSWAVARERSLRYGERIDLDMELYELLSEPLRTLKQEETSGRLRKDKLTPLQRVMLEKFDTYEKRYREIQRRRAITDRREKAKPENQLDGSERVFQSGEESSQATAFVIETEILAAHAFGYDLTNGGQIIRDYRLDPRKFHEIEQAQVPCKVRQALEQMKSAVDIRDPEVRGRMIIDAIATATGVGGLSGGVALGTLFGLALGNPGLGAALGAAAGAVGGVVIAGREIKFGNYVLSLGEAREEKVIDVSIRFDPNLPGSALERITDNPLAAVNFLNQGRRAQDYLNRAQLTRHGIYSRLGLRVENLGTVDWQRLTPKQIALIKSMRYDPRAISAEQKSDVERVAVAGDLWMVDWSSENLSYPAGLMLGFDRAVRENIQIILARDHQDLPVNQISTSVSYRDFSGLPMPERHRIVMEAISIAGMQECREGIDKVLALIATERASSVVIEPILSQLAKDVARIRKGELPLHKSEITQAQMMEGNERLGHAKDTVAVITEQNIAITKLDGEIKEQQAAVVTAENARQAAQAEQGARGLGSGLIAQYEEAKNAAIHEAMTKLGEMRISELIIIPVGTPTEKTINELFYIIQHQLDLSQMKLDEENPAAAKERKSATLAKTPGAETPDLDGRIERGKKLQDEIASLKEALARIKDCRTKIDEQEQKIKDAEKIVRQKEGDKNSADQKLKGLQDRRKAAIGEIWEWVDPDNTRTHPSYGSSLYATLLAEANLNIETVRRELEEQGIPILTEVTPAEVAKGPEVAEKPKTEGEGGKKDEKAEEDKKLEEKGKRAGVIVSKVDRQIADGMEAVINVGKVFGGKVAGLRDMTEDQLQREFADPATSQDNLIRYFFGPQALTPDKKPMYLRLLSKAGLVEAYFDYTGMDDSRAASFLARDPDFLAAYTESRRNNGEIAALRKRLNETHQRKEFGAPGLDDEVKSLEDQIHHLQARNVELLTPIYDKRIAPFLGEGGITTSAYSGMVIERMVRNASEYDPFADAVQSAEAFIPHPGPDGTMTILGPDINPRDNTSINLGHIRWEAPGDYAAVSGQAMKLRTATTIAADGSLDTVVQVKPIDMSGLIAILPDHRNDMVGSRVAEVLDAAGLLPHLYDAAGNKITPDQALGDWARARLPMTRPDMTNQGDVGTARVRDFIQKYGFNESIVDTIYRGTTVGAALNIVELRNVVRGIVSKQIESLEGLQIQGIGIANADALENWLTGGSRYFLGRGVEARRMFASLARAICANSPNVNQLLLGARLGQINIQEAGNTIFVLSNMNGQIMFSYIDSRLGHQVRPLSEIIKLDQAARTGMNVALTDARLNDILANLGKGSLEAIRRRTP